MKRNRILQIVLVLLAVTVVTEGYAQSGVRYPYIQGGDGASNIIVSRDASGGVDPSCIHENWSGATPAHYEEDPENKVAAKFEVATSDMGTSKWVDISSKCPSGWRVPTQRECMLIYVMRDRLKTTNFSTSNYWTATNCYSDKGWYISFRDGYVTSATDENLIRCVRDVN